MSLEEPHHGLISICIGMLHHTAVLYWNLFRIEAPVATINLHLVHERAHVDAFILRERESVGSGGCVDV
jgi:hypothetical protein